jgi:hypothetical protein
MDTANQLIYCPSFYKLLILMQCYFSLFLELPGIKRRKKTSLKEKEGTESF